MIDLQGVDPKADRTRRNLAKMGALLASAAIASLASMNCRLATAKGNGNGNGNNGNGNGNGNNGNGNGNGNGNNGHGNGNQCLLLGTTVATANGDRKVEDLAIGDYLRTMFGGMRPIQWIGRFPMDRPDPSRPWPKDMRPVRIARSAFGPNIPRRDLYVSAGHGLFVDGVLAPAASLINGVTITLCDAREYETLEYFHVKLESHDVIYAEGAPVETLHTASTGAVNFDEYLRLYGPPEGEAIRCAPFVCYDGGRAELRSRARSALSPWVDRRQRLDVIRDRLEERGLALSRHLTAP